METLNYDWDRLLSMGFGEDTVNSLKSACWKGYEAIGLKKKGGRTVPDCVPVDSKHSEGDIATAEMTPNYLPKEPGKGDLKNPQMSEGVPLRMPRSDVLAKASDKNGTLAMRAAPNYGEDGQQTMPKISKKPSPKMVQPAPQKGVKELSKELVKEKTGSGRQKIINKIGKDVLEQS
jgi:hypothetical protein